MRRIQLRRRIRGLRRFVGSRHMMSTFKQEALLRNIGIIMAICGVLILSASAISQADKEAKEDKPVMSVVRN
ncbi:hypothetical protein [Pedobacter sp. SYP-B3415]|uniref:hypothetical protein n=1 Tax=Pedobacter sp. SYP-B3415 TaxID=2496641 RepID=UPI00101DE630|nr:hypothetical protein [Pedobacter sp. SYP-B3415]